MYITILLEEIHMVREGDILNYLLARVSNWYPLTTGKRTRGEDRMDPVFVWGEGEDPVVKGKIMIGSKKKLHYELWMNYELRWNGREL